MEARQLVKRIARPIMWRFYWRVDHRTRELTSPAFAAHETSLKSLRTDLDHATDALASLDRRVRELEERLGPR